MLKTYSSHGPASGIRIWVDELEPVRELGLVGSGLEERLADEVAHRLGVARHAPAEDALRLHRVLLGQPDLAVLAAELGRLEVGLPVHALVRVGDREPERAALGLEPVEVETRLVGDVARRVARLGGEQAVDGQQREPLLGHRLAQLLDRHAIGLQLVEQRAPRVTGGVVRQALEQSFRFPIHASAGRYPAPR